MLFNSFEFLLFFPIVIVIYFLLPQKLRWFHLLIASCVFYMAFIPVYILILFFTIVIDYFAGIWISRSTGSKRKFYLIISIVSNLAVLCIFKYYNFFTENVNAILYSTGISNAYKSVPYLNLILPIGLSFHTFQAMSYTIEVYRGNQKAERHFGIYTLYVMFFPQLVAGPIERPYNLIHQFREKHEFDIDRIYGGLRLMLWGLFKKVVIADRLSLYVGNVFENISGYGSGNLLMAVFFFSIQIYCDFSGYSDIAIGSAQVMGFKLMTNFDRPYFSKNIQEFWRRWHISLSSWFRDYLYKPLGGNSISIVKTCINLLIVFFLSGLWHGANYTFIAWGTVHGLLMIIFLLYRKLTGIPPGKSFYLKLPSMLFTFLLVSLAWIFFRANSIADAGYILNKIFEFDFSEFTFMLRDATNRVEFGKTSMAISLLSIGILFLNDRFQRVDQSSLQQKPIADILYNAFILFLVIAVGVFNQTNFIYFQF